MAFHTRSSRQRRCTKRRQQSTRKQQRRQQQQQQKRRQQHFQRGGMNIEPCKHRALTKNQNKPQNESPHEHRAL